MKKLSRWLYKKVTNKVLILAVCVFSLFIAVVAPMAARYMDTVTEGAPSPDTSLIYSAQDLFDMAQDYGEEGRRAYVLMRFTFDLAFPAAYLFFLVAVLTKLLKYLPQKSIFRYLNALPFIAVFFDLTENIMTAWTIGMYPQKMMFAANVAPIATMIKWVFVGSSFAMIVVFGVLYLIGRIMNSKKEVS